MLTRLWYDEDDQRRQEQRRGEGEAAAQRCSRHS